MFQKHRKLSKKQDLIHIFEREECSSDFNAINCNEIYHKTSQKFCFIHTLPPYTYLQQFWTKIYKMCNVRIGIITVLFWNTALISHFYSPHCVLISHYMKVYVRLCISLFENNNKKFLIFFFQVCTINLNSLRNFRKMHKYLCLLLNASERMCEKFK